MRAPTAGKLEAPPQIDADLVGYYNPFSASTQNNVDKSFGPVVLAGLAATWLSPLWTKSLFLDFELVKQLAVGSALAEDEVNIVDGHERYTLWAHAETDSPHAQARLPCRPRRLEQWSEGDT